LKAEELLMQREYQENLEKEPDVTQFHLDNSLYGELNGKVISKYRVAISNSTKHKFETARNSIFFKLD
jgi:hypothetical protein